MKKLVTLLMSLVLLSSSVSFANTSINNTFEDLNSFVSSYKNNSGVKSENSSSNQEYDRVVLGNERLLTDYENLIKGKKLGLVTNQTGVDANLVKTVDKLYNYKDATLTAIYSPEHGLDGKATAGQYVASYTDSRLNLPVFSLYGQSREPSKAMLDGIDVLIFDMQDIGSRTYTYMSTLNYVMKAAKKYNKPVIVLDRPNPLGGSIVEGYVAEDKYLTFVGVDNLPIAHGMTSGELAKFFNRKIGADITVVPMQNYTRDMIWQDTGLTFVATSPNIPNITSAFGYIATGMGEGTSVGQSDKFTWVGSAGINSTAFANKMNSYKLPGVTFSPETKSSRGGARLTITDYHKFNPTKTSIYTLTTINSMKKLTVPTEQKGVIPMFEKIWGGNRFGLALTNKVSAEKVIQSYQNELNSFKKEREKYLIY
ncbi:MAG: DUF1343 domain-containing protein [Proteocatella sp.]